MVDTPGKVTLWGIEVFAAAVEEGSISAAARRLGVSPSSVSQQLSNLETALGAHAPRPGRPADGGDARGPAFPPPGAGDPERGGRGAGRACDARSRASVALQPRHDRGFRRRRDARASHAPGRGPARHALPARDRGEPPALRPARGADARPDRGGRPRAGGRVDGGSSAVRGALRRRGAERHGGRGGGCHGRASGPAAHPVHGAALHGPADRRAPVAAEPRRSATASNSTAITRSWRWWPKARAGRS